MRMIFLSDFLVAGAEPFVAKRFVAGADLVLDMFVCVCIVKIRGKI
jgi:hypothetical protein